MTRAAERLFALVRATLRNRMDDASLFEGTDAAQWREIYDLSSVQGVLAQAWDGMQLLPRSDAAAPGRCACNGPSTSNGSKRSTAGRSGPSPASRRSTASMRSR